LIQPFFHHDPLVPASAYVHPGATVVGQVSLGEHSSVWPGAVLRGDINAISLGDYSNVQDDSVLHVGDHHAVEVGREVVIGHAARVHGCRIGDGCLVGIGAVVLNGAVVGEGSILAAGTLVPENSALEPGHLYMGVPARQKRALSGEERVGIRRMARKYAFIAEAHRRNAEALARGERLDRSDWESLMAELRASVASLE
jgi:carbonic anhydrase/acetyltransferase-like protein (isoleucine patch superfamily)